MKLMTSLINISLQILAIVLLFIVALLTGCAGIKTEISDINKCWFDENTVESDYCRWKREQD